VENARNRKPIILSDGDVDAVLVEVVKVRYDAIGCCCV
jgi:hypothetical protein